ncbi:MAG: hypothetical protein ACI4DY_14860 [Monoglobaceae bacterium]
MDDDSGGIIGFVLIIAAIALAVYCVVALASVIAVVAGAGGTLWGGSTAVVNYYKSFKENMIDSNKAAA